MGVGEGGVRLYFMWFPGGGGGVSLDLNFVRRGEGVIQNLDDGSKFQPDQPWHLNNEKSLNHEL